MPVASDLNTPAEASYSTDSDTGNLPHNFGNLRRKRRCSFEETSASNCIRSRLNFSQRHSSNTHFPRRTNSARRLTESRVNLAEARGPVLPTAHSVPVGALNMQSYRTSQPQQSYGLDLEYQIGTTQSQAFAPFALLAHQCIPVCCAPTMTSAAHVPVNGWAFPAPCGASGVQLIPCCDGSGCTAHHGTMTTTPRHFYCRPAQLGIGPYHCTQFHTHHRLPPPSVAAVPLPPLASNAYQTQHLQPNPIVTQQSIYQHQPPSHQSVYHGHQMPPSASQHVYHQPQLVPRVSHQPSEEMVSDNNVTSNIQYPGVPSQAYQQQPMHHATAGVTGQPLLLQPVPSDFLTGSFPHYRPVTSSRQRYRTYPPMAAPYSGYLLHFLAMLGRPTAFVSATLPHHRANLQHEDFADLDSYEALLNLAERLGEVKSRGLARPDIDRLRCYRYESSGGDVPSPLDQTSCVVCLCDFEQQELVRSLPCQHEFHAHCVDKWLKMNRTCPLCRADVTELSKMDVE